MANRRQVAILSAGDTFWRLRRAITNTFNEGVDHLHKRCCTKFIFVFFKAFAIEKNHTQHLKKKTKNR